MNAYAIGALAFAVGYALGMWFVHWLVVVPQRARIAALEASLEYHEAAVQMLIAENQQLRREMLTGATPRPRMPVGSLFHRN